MRNLLFSCLVTLASVVPGPLWAETAPVQESSPKSEGEISWWVGELDSELFDTRERSQKRLTEAGIPAINEVVEAARNGTLESSTRALNILLTWSEAEEAKLQVAALEALAGLDNRPKEAAIAKEMLAQVRENVALKEIAKLGGSFQVGVQINGMMITRPDHSIQIVIGSEWKGGVEGLEHLTQVPHAVLVCYHSAPLGDEALEVLERMPQLLRVELYGAKQITPEAIENLKGKIKAQVDVGSGAFLGVQGMTSGNQAIVAKVVAESAADKAGIRENDIIAKINGEEIKDFLAMKDLIAQHEPGDSVMFTILRPRPNETPETLELKVTFAQWGIKGAGAVTPINMGREVNTLPKVDLHKFRLDRR